MMTLLLVYLALSLFVTLALVGAAVLSGMAGKDESEYAGRAENEASRLDSAPVSDFKGVDAYPTAAYQFANLSVNCLQDKDTFLRDAEAIYDELSVWRTSNPETRYEDSGAQFAPRRSRQLVEMLK